MNSIDKTPARGGSRTRALAYVGALARTCVSAGDRARAGTPVSTHIRTHAFAFTLAFVILTACLLVGC